MENYLWNNPTEISSRHYKCGYCGKDAAPDKGYVATDVARNKYIGHIYICPYCKQPTFIDSTGKQTPKLTLGNDVLGISDNKVSDLYQEARNCTSTGAYTGAVMVCRKILMNLAVQHNAKENESFVYYVNFLVDGGFVPPKGKVWVDAIRKLGNEATHEISLMTEKDAQLILRFTEALLRFNFELPHIFEEHNKP